MTAILKLSARDRLLQQETYNSRSFPLITEELIAAVEREAEARALARVAETVRELAGFDSFGRIELEDVLALLTPQAPK